MNILKRIGIAAMAVMMVIMVASCQRAETGPQQLTLQKDLVRIPLFDAIMPEDYKLIDWRDKALRYDALVFDESASGTFLPLIWRDESYDTYGIPAYVGDSRMGRDGAQEAVTNIAAVLSGTLMGLDKSAGDADYVEALSAFYSESERIILNNPAGTSATTSMWYLLYPTILFAHVSAMYDDHTVLREKLLSAIDSWYRAYEIMYNNGEPDFNYTGFNFLTMEPYRNNVWTEPDSAAGIGVLMYYGYMLTGEEKYLTASIRCMEYIEQFFGSPLYEALMYFAPALAARLNAMHGTEFDVSDILNDTLTSTAIPRGGWGMIVGKWGDYDMDGLLGSTTDGGGYAFAMNTFAGTGAIVPTVRYDARYARSIGIWMLNVVSNARYFFAGETKAENQSCTYTEDCQDIDERIREAVPYEGIRKSSQGRTPWFGGDPTVYGWAQTDFSLYSGAHLGILASLVEATNVERILRLNLQATGFYSEHDYPMYMLYNPYTEAKQVEYRVTSQGAVDLFNTVTNTVIANGVSGTVMLEVPADDALVVIELPAGTAIETDGAAYYADGRWISRGLLALQIAGKERDDTVSGKFKLEARWIASYPAELKRIIVEIDDQTLEFAPEEPIELDAKQYGSGSKRIWMTIETTDGVTDRSSIRLRFE